MKKFKEFVSEAEAGAQKTDDATRVKQVQDKQKQDKLDFETRQRRDMELARQADFRTKEQKLKADQAKKQAETSSGK